MKIVTNHKTINRNRKIGQYTTLASLGILVVGFIISLQPDPALFIWSFAALIGGFMLSQVGIYFGNRWGRSPRPDEKMVAGLKGLEDKYTLYNYMTAVPHLLVGPAGIWILAPFQQKGVITFNQAKNRWQQKGGNALLKLFAQEGLGRPDQELTAELSDLNAFISKNSQIENLPTPQVAMVFLDDKASVQAQDAPIPTLHIDKVKDFIRRQAKESPALIEPIRSLQKILPEESIE